MSESLLYIFMYLQGKDMEMVQLDVYVKKIKKESLKVLYTDDTLTLQFQSRLGRFSIN